MGLGVPNTFSAVTGAVKESEEWVRGKEGGMGLQYKQGEIHVYRERYGVCEGAGYMHREMDGKNRRREEAGREGGDGWVEEGGKG